MWAPMVLNFFRYRFCCSANEALSKSTPEPSRLYSSAHIDRRQRTGVIRCLQSCFPSALRLQTCDAEDCSDIHNTLPVTTLSICTQSNQSLHWLCPCSATTCNTTFVLPAVRGMACTASSLTKLVQVTAYLKPANTCYGPSMVLSIIKRQYIAGLQLQ